ncbi:alpha-defensin 26-like [Mus caroli]|uniref:Alpha-defensin 26-like n=1 Tax=Mus caroli TaxID=10089 RepID=A0A6P5P3F7_MUSCR|nr:alpha-defensin 26-like [Mus caroli]
MKILVLLSALVLLAFQVQAALRDLGCYCRKRGCTRRERINGTCRKGHLMYTLCCL